MLARTIAAAVQGIDAIRVEIEVTVDWGSGFLVIGLPDTAVKESAERVRCAIQQAGIEFPGKRVMVNMSPADIKKEGSAYDLPLAIGIMAADEKISTERLDRYMFMGELSLDGSLRPVKGALPMAILARELKLDGFILPRDNALEAAVVNNLNIYGVDNFTQVVQFLNGDISLEPTVVDTRAEFAKAQGVFPYDFADVKGQENVKRAFEVACAGGHNILLVPGFGQIDDGQALAVHHAAPHPERSPRDDQNPQRGRQTAAGHHADDRAPLPQPPPHHLARRPSRRREFPHARRNQSGAQWRALPGRATRIQSLRFGGDAATVGGQDYQYF